MNSDEKADLLTASGLFALMLITVGVFSQSMALKMGGAALGLISMAGAWLLIALRECDP